jgi:hypothetical protein
MKVVEERKKLHLSISIVTKKIYGKERELATISTKEYTTCYYFL